MALPRTTTKEDGQHRVRLLGGETMSVAEYSDYMDALSKKPFLSTTEANALFGVGINLLREHMKMDECPFVVCVGPGKTGRKIDRELLQQYITDGQFVRRKEG